MVAKSWYIDNCLLLTDTLDGIKDDFPCWVQRDLIEMDMSYVTIEAREEDMPAIENRLAPLVQWRLKRGELLWK